jgi:RND family efflux transporter MFP subunit
MKTKIILSLGLIAIISVIIVILFNNRAKSNKAVKNEAYIFYPVNVTQAARENLHEQLSFTGTINAYNDVTIVSETSGKVTQVFADVNDSRSAGSVIIKVDDEIKKANLKLAEVNFNKAKKDLERFKELKSNNSASDQQLENAQLAFDAAEAQRTIANRQFNDTKITTPISGVITSRAVEVGNMVNNGMAVANIANITQMKVKINLGESDVFKIKIGDTVSITTDVYPEYRYKGKIKSISDKSDDLHTYAVEIVITNNKTYPLRAGMFGRIDFNSKYNGTSIIIPRESLVGSSRNPRVFVVKNDIASLRNLEVGITLGTKVQVIKGLEEGETVVVNGHSNLKEGYKVTIVK